MSADRYTTCPKCTQERDKKKEAMKAKAQKAYGKVSPEEFLRLSNPPVEIDAYPDSLREDWEIGCSEGEFSIRYSANCDRCDFHFEFKHDEEVIKD